MNPRVKNLSRAVDFDILEISPEELLAEVSHLRFLRERSLEEKRAKRKAMVASRTTVTVEGKRVFIGFELPSPPKVKKKTKLDDTLQTMAECGVTLTPLELEALTRALSRGRKKKP